MKAYKSWDASGTCARVAVEGAWPAGARTMHLACEEIPDGVTTILDPVALLIRHADGSEERVEIQDVSDAELSASVDISGGSES